MNVLLRMVFLVLALSGLSGCDWWWEEDDEVEVSIGAGESAETVSVDSSSVEGTGENGGDANPVSETGVYWGRTNGDRPTWYFSKEMDSYPASFELDIPGCSEDILVTNNGDRWEQGGYLAKQSDVSGRGLAVLAPASCASSTAIVQYSQ